MNDYERQQELIKASVMTDIPKDIIEWLDDDAIRRIYSLYQFHNAQMVYANSLEIMEQLPKGTYVRWERDGYVCRILDENGQFPDSGEATGYGDSRSGAILHAVLHLIDNDEKEKRRESAIEPSEGPDNA